MSQDAPDILLRDIHSVPAPGIWPPAPGWWIVFALLVLAMIVLLLWRRRVHRHRRRVEAVFDAALASAEGGPAEVAAVSALLRRAARRHHPDADTAEGAQWLALLAEDMPGQGFEGDPGRLLLEGGFRRETDPETLAALRVLARRRFLSWMGVRP